MRDDLLLTVDQRNSFVFRDIAACFRDFVQTFNFLFAMGLGVTNIALSIIGT